MRLSNYFIPTSKEISNDITTKSHQLMLKSGMIYQNGIGLYSFLPIGFKVLRKIENIIQEEFDKINALRINMPIIQSKEIWNESGRGDYCGNETLKILDRHQKEYFFSPTNEEIANDIIRSNIKSYKDFPKSIYQINWKFRDEIRPRFGLLRAREFLMMDAYSFHLDKKCAEETYYKYYQCYLKIFKRLNLNAIPMKADSGPIGGDLSHEFQIIAESGESDIYFDSEILNQENSIEALQKMYACTEDKFDSNKIPNLNGNLMKKKGIEVGHIFYVGNDKYSKSMNLKIENDNNEFIYLEMCTYGIGISRLIAAIIEVYNDNYGIIWPESISPFDILLINLDPSDKICIDESERIYEELSKEYDILYDDSSKSFGEKMANGDLIGIPKQIIIGSKLNSQNKCQIKIRKTGEKSIIDIKDIKKIINQSL